MSVALVVGRMGVRANDAIFVVPVFHLPTLSDMFSSVAFYLQHVYTLSNNGQPAYPWAVLGRYARRSRSHSGHWGCIGESVPPSLSRFCRLHVGERMPPIVCRWQKEFKGSFEVTGTGVPFDPPVMVCAEYLCRSVFLHISKLLSRERCWRRRSAIL